VKASINDSASYQTTLVLVNFTQYWSQCHTREWWTGDLE